MNADATLGPDPAGGSHIPPIKLTVRGKARGIDAAASQTAADGGERREVSKFHPPC